MQSITQIAYFSRSKKPIDLTEGAKLLNLAVERNRQLNVTGFLLHGGDWYFQVIEGVPSSVELLFKSIECDPRHMVASTWRKDGKIQRDFREWRMGVARAADLKLGIDRKLLEGDSPFEEKIKYVRSLAESYTR